ncbi:hypothetical protein BJY01DRAFT_241769 [Aspergillus pseudoustus]|uniref:F-box domain-containing protein n=1 Tax=Aspergillus pseudoustus TaxID=1810923 RepID=A0ABR4L2P1_9EURO
MEFKLPVLKQFLGFATPRNPLGEPPKSRLQELPAEIYLLILQYLDQGDKLRLLRASHDFYDLILPQIYEHLDTRRTQSLVQTLVHKPSLCDYPRSLRLSKWEVPRWRDDRREDSKNIERDPVLRQYDVSLVIAKAREASLSEAEAVRWQEDIKGHNPDAWTGLLLTLLPNLVRLQVQFPELSSYVPRIIIRAATGQYKIPVLRNVEEVAVSAAAFEPNGPVASLVSPFPGLPRLRWLFTNDLNETCLRLESFRYGYFNHYIYPSLIQRNHTIKELWLDIDRGRDRTPNHCPSFTQFSALRLLHAPHYLLGHFDHDSPRSVRCLLNTLPASLRTMHVTEVNTGALGYLFPCLVEYVGSRQARLSELVIATTTFIPDNAEQSTRLNTITIADPDTVERDTRPVSIMEHVMELRNACSASGTRFAIHKKDSESLAHWSFEEPFIRLHTAIVK